MKILNFFICLITIIMPTDAFASDVRSEQIYTAQVIEIQNEINNILSDGSSSKQQDLKLIGLSDEIKNKIIFYKGIGLIDALNKKIYRPGDKVYILISQDDSGQEQYYIIDYDRTASLLLIFLIFIISLFAVGGIKGIKSLVSLALTFLIIIKFILPQISAGQNIFIIALIGSFIILLINLYFTEGFGPIAHISLVSIFFSLSISMLLAWFFVETARLTGFIGEDEASLYAIFGETINFQGLLLVGIMIGAIGVLDDLVLAQVTSVKQLHFANPFLSKKELFKKAGIIGISHITSMTNTLFLAYAGVSLTMLTLLTSGQSALRGFFQIINNEAFATEIVRTLSGAVGLILSVPIATLLAVLWFKKE